MSEKMNGAAVAVEKPKDERPKDERPTVFYAEGIVIHRNECLIPTTTGPKLLPACKVATVASSYLGSVEGLVDLLNVGWAVLAQHENRRVAKAAAGEKEAGDVATH